MNIWNYRIIRYDPGTEQERCQIHEVEYDAELRPIGLGESFRPVAQDAQLLSHQMIHAMSAFTKPVLDYNTLVAPFDNHSAQTAADLLRPKNV